MNQSEIDQTVTLGPAGEVYVKAVRSGIDYRKRLAKAERYRAGLNRKFKPKRRK